VPVNHSDITFSWHKKCSSSWVEHPRPGLYISTTRDGHDVIADGRTVAEWDYEKQQVGYNTQILNFWIWINPAEIGIHPRTQPFNITHSSTFASGVTVPNYQVHAFNTTGVASVDNGPIHFAVWVTCQCMYPYHMKSSTPVSCIWRLIDCWVLFVIANGRGDTRIRVALAGYYDTISFYFKKTCEFPKLQMGLIEGQHSEIMKDSTVQSSWNYVESAAQTTFYFWLPAGDTVTQVC
jgi:hypothetical protein